MKNFVRTYFPKTIQSFLRRSYYRFPILRKMYYLPNDLWTILTGKRNDATPPRSKIFVGDGNFNEIGKDFLSYFIDLGKLKSDEKVLEVGSGIGRMALPLTAYLTEGEYEGIDIVKSGVDWCNKNISSKHINFKFHLADIKNKVYNPKGQYDASQYKFPFADSHFDFIFLTSVFTHMLPSEVKNYISEISRVLKKNGRAFITFFLLNSQAMTYVQTSGNRFSDELDGCRLIDKNIPEAAIAYQESFIKKLLFENNLHIDKPIYYGSWCNRETFTSSQDIIIVTKKNNL